MNKTEFRFVLHRSLSYENFKTEFETTSDKTFYDKIDDFSFELDRISLHLTKSTSTSNLTQIEKLEQEQLFLINMDNLREARQSLPTCADEKDFERFIEVSDRLFEKFTTPADRKDFVTVLLTKLDGKAQQIARCCEQKTWPAIKKAILNQFKNTLDVDTVYRQITNCRQLKNELISDYSLRIKMLLKDLEEAYTKENVEHAVPKQTQLKYFVAGIRDFQLKTLVKAMHFDELEQAIEFAITEENHTLAQVLPTTNVVCEHCSSVGHKIFDCIQFRTENNICEKCKKVGHWPKDCLQKNHIFPNNNNFSRFNNNRYSNGFGIDPWVNNFGRVSKSPNFNNFYNQRPYVPNQRFQDQRPNFNGNRFQQQRTNFNQNSYGPRPNINRTYNDRNFNYNRNVNMQPTQNYPNTSQNNRNDYNSRPYPNNNQRIFINNANCKLCLALDHNAQNCPVLNRIRSLNLDTPGTNPAVIRLED
jgi:hypothetical protein